MIRKRRNEKFFFALSSLGHFKNQPFNNYVKTMPIPLFNQLCRERFLHHTDVSFFTPVQRCAPVQDPVVPCDSYLVDQQV